MKKILIFVLLLGCSEEHDIKRLCSPFMTISDALPVQFWVNGVETYNQKEVFGITPVCFCQPVNCDDEIRIQFRDTSGQVFDLVIYDASETVLTRLTFSEIASGVYELSFVPSENSICEMARFEIWDSAELSQLISNNEFTTNLTGWNQTSVLEERITWSGNFGGSAGYGMDQSLGDLTNLFYQNFVNVNAGKKIHVQSEVNFDNSSFVDEEITVQLVLLQDGNVISVLQEWKLSESPSGDFSFDNYILLTNRVNGIGYNFITAIGTGNLDVYIKNIYINLVGNLQAQSDCIDLKTSHEGTKLIRYENSKNFADIDYQNFSPTAEFYIRVPAVFFHEEYPEEQENIELSSQNIVRLRNEVKAKRRLELAYLPYYMHRKLKLILAHDTVEIDGENWIRQDAYEIDGGNKHYPLKRAEVLLTEKNYIKRNIL